MVSIFEEDIEGPSVDLQQINKWFEAIVQVFNVQIGDIAIVVCSDEYLLAVNIEHLNHDYYTDIITFDYTEGSCVSGDLFISWERVMDNAKQFNVASINEFYRVCAHGLLHLLGFKDKSQAEAVVMREKEDWALSLLDVSRETL